MSMQSTTKATVNSIIVALPTVIFLVSSSHTTLRYALLLAGLAAAATFVYHLLRHEPILPALGGFIIASVCAAVALITGQARAFFLIPAIVLPVVICLVCLGSIIVRRPLAGLLLNRMTSGPQQWWTHYGLRRVYTIATWVCLAVNGSTGLLQRFFYVSNNVFCLGVVHIATPLIFSAIIASTIFYAKREMATYGLSTAAEPRASVSTSVGE